MNQISSSRIRTTTSQLTADRSTAELMRNNGRLDLIEFNSRSQPITNMNLKFPSIPSPILTKKLKGISELEEVGESEEERNIEIETISEGGGGNQKQRIEENTSSSLFSEEEVDPSKIDQTEKL
ncbi:hypothetical protein PVK06_020442 [Gossypium arboreum]|uniref:Uncharacterized protein n=1 Tax=Gossypium arboreum TaxID=29729 RepID=A0ABR0PMC8_GOSAR|nr:hypothetical protein PVK06_020442 [Gossypium arboreum]